MHVLLFIIKTNNILYYSRGIFYCSQTIYEKLYTYYMHSMLCVYVSTIITLNIYNKFQYYFTKVLIGLTEL